MNDVLRVGLIGTGYMGKCHALAWNAVNAVFGAGPPVRLEMLAEVDSRLAQERARALGFERSTGDWRDLVEDPQVDVVSVTAPNAFHAEMAIAALEAGKHVWCEKPMAPSLPDAIRMRDAARTSGCVAALGYNYIQNPLIRETGELLRSGKIGEVSLVRLEMDEDFMADPEEFFYWKSEAASGYGALDDFAVHPLSILWKLMGPVASVCCDMAKPYADRPLREGGRRKVESHDIANCLFRLENGASGSLLVNRSAWGRKGRIAIQIFGSKGSILFDQERMNELQLYDAEAGGHNVGYTNILASPVHEPYGRFVPAPGHGLGFNDLKIIECRELLNSILGEPSRLVDFETGVEIERAVHAMGRSHETRGWVDVASV